MCALKECINEKQTQAVCESLHRACTQCKTGLLEFIESEDLK